MKIVASSLLMLWAMLVSGCVIGPSGKSVVLSGKIESREGPTSVDLKEWVRQAPSPTRKFKHLFIFKEDHFKNAMDYLYVNDFALVKMSFPASKQYPRRDGHWLQAKGDRQWFKDWGDGQPEELCWESAYRWLYAKDDGGQFIGMSNPVLLQIKAPLPQKTKSKCLSSS